MLIGAAAMAVAAVILIVGSSGTSTGTNANTTYHQKLAISLSPLISANNHLSASLTAISGSNTNQEKRATTQAQTALIAARGAVGVLTVPSGSALLAQQTQQALTQESGYLQLVSATLANPTGNSVTGLQGLASSTASAFVPLASIAPGGQPSLFGTDALLRWTQAQTAAQKRRDAAAQRKALKQAAASASHTTVIRTAPPVTPPPQVLPPPQVTPSPPVTPSSSGYVTPSGAPVPGSWSLGSAAYASGVGTPYSWSAGRACDQNIFAGKRTSCSFADNIFEVVAAASYYNSVIPGSITAYSPTHNTNFALTCTEYLGTDGQNALQCITATGTGAAFPVAAANVYYG